MTVYLHGPGGTLNLILTGRPCRHRQWEARGKVNHPHRPTLPRWWDLCSTGTLQTNTNAFQLFEHNSLEETHIVTHFRRDEHCSQLDVSFAEMDYFLPSKINHIPTFQRLNSKWIPIFFIKEVITYPFLNLIQLSKMDPSHQLSVRTVTR